MELLNNKLKQIIQFLDNPSTSQHTGDKAICYLTFPFEDVLEVKKNTETLVSLLKHYNYNVSVLSIGNIIHEFIKNNPRKDTWNQFSKVEYKDEMTDFFKNISSTIIQNRIIENAILEKQNEIKNKPKALLLLTDLEGIHPFTRFGPVEQNIYNSIEIPIVILYPGQLNGSSLEFLGFYPPDGNYRSKHY
jgi:hypothetical protein